MRSARGFTLIEMAVVIAIIGLLMTILVGITRVVLTQQRYQVTRTRMANIDTSLAVFVATNKRLPCPADGRTASGAAGAGTEASTGAGAARTCTNTQQFGVLPWTALGLTASDAEDGWGTRFTYRVGPALVVDNGMDFTSCDAAGSITTGVTVAPWCNTLCTTGAMGSCTTPSAALAGAVGKGVVVEDASGNLLADPRTSPTTGAAYVLISHGPEGGGGYAATGLLQSSSIAAGTQEAKNFANIAYTVPPVAGAPTVFLVDDDTNGNVTTAHFDDLVIRTGVLALAVKAQVGPRSH